MNYFVNNINLIFEGKLHCMYLIINMNGQKKNDVHLLQMSWPWSITILLTSLNRFAFEILSWWAFNTFSCVFTILSNENHKLFKCDNKSTQHMKTTLSSNWKKSHSNKNRRVYRSTFEHIWIEHPKHHQSIFQMQFVNPKI